MSDFSYAYDPSIYDGTQWEAGTAIPKRRPAPQQAAEPAPYEFAPLDPRVNVGAPPVPAAVTGPTRNARGGFAREVAYSRPKAAALVQALAQRRGGQA